MATQIGNESWVKYTLDTGLDINARGLLVRNQYCMYLLLLYVSIICLFCVYYFSCVCLMCACYVSSVSLMCVWCLTNVCLVCVQ